MRLLKTQLKQVLCVAGTSFFLYGFSLQAHGAEPPAIWTARDAVIYALTNSPESRIAQQRIAAAQAAQRSDDAAFQPSVQLSAGYSQTNNPMYAFGSILNQGGFDPDLDFNDPGRIDNLGLKAEVRYRFYNGGRDEAARQAGQARFQASQTDRTAIEHLLGSAVVRAYQEIIQAKDQLAARHAELETIEASLAVAKARYNAGELLRTDMLYFEVQQAHASEQLIIGRHHYELAQKVFLNLLGLPEAPVELAPSDEDNQALPQPGDYRERPEVTAMLSRITSLEAELAGARGAHRPTIDGFAGYQYDRGWETGEDGTSWQAGMQVQYDLWDGGQRDAVIAKKTAELAELKEQLAKLRLALDLEIQEAVLNYRQATERRSVTEKMVRVAEENALLNRERFQQGVILVSDLIDTETRRTDALVRQSAARANCRIAVAMLRQAVGLQQFAPTTKELLEKQQ